MYFRYREKTARNIDKTNLKIPTMIKKQSARLSRVQFRWLFRTETHTVHTTLALESPERAVINHFDGFHRARSDAQTTIILPNLAREQNMFSKKRSDPQNSNRMKPGQSKYPE